MVNSDPHTTDTSTADHHKGPEMDGRLSDDIGIESMADLERALENVQMGGPMPTPAAQPQPQPVENQQPEPSEQAAQPEPGEKDDFVDPFDNPTLNDLAIDGRVDSAPKPEPAPAEQQTDQVNSDQPTQTGQEGDETGTVNAKPEDSEEAAREFNKRRYRPQNEVEDLALNVLQDREEYKDKSLKELLGIAERILNPEGTESQVDSETSETDEEEENQTTNEDDGTGINWDALSSQELLAKASELQEEAWRLEEEAAEAKADYDGELEREKTLEAIAAQRAMHKARSLAEQVQADEQAWNDAFAASQEIVLQARPQAHKDSGSEYNKRMTEIYESMVASNDPRLNDPNYPEVIQEIADKYFGLTDQPQPQQSAPSTQSHHPAPVPPVRASEVSPQVRQQRAAPAPAPGSAGRGDRTAEFQTVLDGIQTEAQLEDLLMNCFGR